MRNQTIALFFVITTSFSLSACRMEDAEKVTYDAACSKGAAPFNGNQFDLTPETMAAQLFNKNSSILLGINRVHQSKDELNIARASLLPSLNLSTLLYSSMSSTFTVSAVEVLFPFLVPGNWIKLKESKYLYKAQLKATQTIQLNTLASALSVYSSILADRNLLSVYQDEITDLGKVAETVQDLYQSGLASKSDLDRARGTWQFAKIGFSKIDGLVNKEIASLRHLLALPLTTSLSINPMEIDPSEFEQRTPAEIQAAALKVSPEMEQLLMLKKAAERNSWSQYFAFIQGSGVRSPAGAGSSIAFDNVNIGMNFNIGYAQVPTIKLSEDRIKEIKIRINELQYEIGEQSEYAFALVKEAKDRHQYAVEAAELMKSAYDRDVIRYQYGLVDLQTVLTSRSQYRDAVLESLSAKTQLALNRIVLHRLLGSDKFATLPSCQ
ncbi:MAG: TolC family protein [Bdellovibrionaceae bacterium]|nr:TolC family protein [Pseudobdellovibrionaceae bacterium]